MTMGCRRWTTPAGAAAALAALVLVTACGPKQLPRAMGAYRLEDGRLISLRRSSEGTFRARVYDSGESRRLHREGPLRYVAGPGFSSRSPIDVEVTFLTDSAGMITGLTWKRGDGAAIVGRRIGREETVTFRSDGSTLFGRLRLPAGGGPHPAVVLVHGSGEDAATGLYYNGDFLAAHGIATLTYDKRGTGRSEGEFTFDFGQLSRDVVAAVDAVAVRGDIDEGRIGLSGYSQGAWVAPLAAAKSDRVRFVLAHYGMTASPAEEARVETRNILRQRGVDEAALSEVDELTRASVAIVASDFRGGWDELAEIKRKSRRAPWRRELSGTVIGKFVKYPPWLIRMIGPRSAPSGLDWYHDSTDILERLSIPMVWLLAERDSSAPTELALPTLRRLQAEGKPYQVVVFPGAEHTMLLFEEREGERAYTGYAPDYFRTEVEAARRLAQVP